MTYVTIWSGALEAAGQAPGLSSYQGRSSLHHGTDALTEDPDWIERRQKRMRYAGKPHGGERRARGGDKQKRHPKGSLDHLIVPMLKKGVSLQQIANELNISPCMPRRVAKTHGITLKGRMKGAKQSAGTWAVGA